MGAKDLRLITDWTLAAPVLRPVFAWDHGVATGRGRNDLAERLAHA